MTKAIETPDFLHESEEAEWWANNQSVLLKEFQKDAKEGTMGHGTLSQRAKASSITIRLDPEDLALARVQAQECGLRYQTYLKMLLHQALVKNKAVTPPLTGDR